MEGGGQWAGGVNVERRAGEVERVKGRGAQETVVLAAMIRTADQDTATHTLVK